MSLLFCRAARPVTAALVLMLNCPAVAGEAVDGVQLEIRLDSREVRFPDPIYAFVQVRNVAAEPGYTPLLDAMPSIDLHCGPGVASQQLEPAESPVIAIQRSGFFSVGAFQLSYTELEFLTFLADDEQCRATASLRIRPADIEPESMAEGKPFRLYEHGRDREFITAEAEAEFVLSFDRTVFKVVPDDLMSIARQPAGWRTHQQVREIAYGLTRPHGISDCGVAHIDRQTIENVPLVSNFPDRLDSIQEMLLCDTASWRLLEMRKLLRRYYLETSSRDEVKRVIDDLINLLKCCGPAELVVLERRISLALNYSPGQFPGVSAEDCLRITTFARAYWAEQLREHFPDDPMHGLLFVSDYAKDETQIKTDQIDIDKPRGRQMLESAWEGSGKVEPQPCSCEGIEAGRAGSQAGLPLTAPEHDPVSGDIPPALRLYVPNSISSLRFGDPIFLPIAIANAGEARTHGPALTRHAADLELKIAAGNTKLYISLGHDFAESVNYEGRTGESSVLLDAGRRS